MKRGDQFHVPMRACVASVLLVCLIFLGSGFAVAQDSPQLMDHTMCKGLNEKKEPIGRTDTFSTQDASAYSSIKIGPVNGAHKVDWNWYSPNRELYYSSTRTIDPLSKGTYYLEWDWASCWIFITGQDAERMPGDWHVEILIDGRLIATEKFSLISQPEEGSYTDTALPEGKTARDWISEGNAFLGQGKYDEALQAYDNALQLDSQLADVWYDKGVVLNKQGKYDDAIAAYDNAIGLNPKFAYAWCNKGDSLQRKGSYGDAIKAYDKAIELDPTDAYPLNNKGVVLSKQGKYEDAIKAFDQALGIDPKNEEAISNKRTAEAALAKKQPSVVEQPGTREVITIEPGEVTEIPEPVIIRHEPLSQTINPSDQPQTVSYQDTVKVTLPGGLLKEPQTLTIAKVDGLPGKEIPFLKSGDQYEISLGDIHTFVENVTIEMAYDPASITEGVSPLDQLIVTSWNETRRMWERAEFEVDESSNLVVAKTKHLSIWSLWYGFQKGMKPKFLDKNSASGSCEIRFWIYATSNPPCEFPHVSREYSVEDYLGAAAKGKEVTLRDVIMDYFSKSWDAYASKKFQMPTGKFDVFIDPESVDPDTKFCDIESVIIFPAPLEFWRPSEFKHNVAHELFHVIQNQYLNAISMGWGTSLGIGRKWWIEATADYAAAKVAWPHDDGVQSFAVSSLKPYYLEAPLDYFSDNEKDKFYYHQYQTSAFVDFLVSHAGVNFKEMWEYTASPSWRDIQDALDPLDKFLRSKKTPIVGIELTEGLREKYLQFAEFYLFDQNSPIPDSDTVPDGALNKKTELSSSKKKDVWEVKLDPDYTAKVWELSVSPEVGNSVILNVSFDSSSSDVVEMDQENPFIGIGTSGSGFEWVRIYKLEGFKRTSATEAYVTTIDAKDEKSAEVEISPWDGLYVLAINPYGSWLNLKLNANLSIPTLEIQRPFSESEKGVPETEYRFSVIKSDIPSDAEYEWDFGDGETADGESVTHKFESEGDYAVGVQATWSGGSAENETDIEIVPPSVEIQKPFILQKEKGAPETPYFFSVIKSGIPDDAAYEWSFGDGGTEKGEEVIHKFAQEGDYTIRVRASWSGGSAESETVIGIEAVDVGLEAVNVTSCPVQELSGANVCSACEGERNDCYFVTTCATPAKGKFEWSFGDGGKATYDDSKDGAVVKHHYSSADTYTVSVAITAPGFRGEGHGQIRISECPPPSPPEEDFERFMRTGLLPGEVQ